MRREPHHRAQVFINLDTDRPLLGHSDIRLWQQNIVHRLHPGINAAGRACRFMASIVLYQMERSPDGLFGFHRDFETGYRRWAILDIDKGSSLGFTLDN